MDTQQSMTCSNCGAADVRSDSVRSAFWQDDRLVVVEGIPALVCGKCSERFYDDTTVLMLDLLRGGGFPSEKARAELRVPVFTFPGGIGAKAGP